MLAHGRLENTLSAARANSPSTCYCEPQCLLPVTRSASPVMTQRSERRSRGDGSDLYALTCPRLPFIFALPTDADWPLRLPSPASLLPGLPLQ